MKKQLVALLMAAVVSQGAVVMAQEIETDVVTTAQTMEAVEADVNYSMQVGEITEVVEEGDSYIVLVGDPINGTKLVLDNSQLIIDAATLGYMQSTDLQVGMKITVVVSDKTPMTMSLPAMISEPTAIIVNSEDTQVGVGFFNEELVNKENTLALNIDRNTYIVNTTGEKRVFTAEDIMNQNAVVIYSMTTRSIPAQTSPHMVLILSEDVAPVETNEVQTQETHTEESVEYVGVREVAETKGYKVAWEHNSKSVTLTKENETITFTVGQTTYIHNEVNKEMNVSALLEDGKLVIPQSVVALL